MIEIRTRREARRQDTAEAIARARAGFAILSVRVYCDNDACCVREITIATKDPWRELVEQVQRGLVCPACRRTPKLEWVANREELDRHEERRARESVNEQMRRRDYQVAHPDKLYCTNLRDLCDGRLPPTPDGWFDK